MVSLPAYAITGLLIYGLVTSDLWIKSIMSTKLQHEAIENIVSGIYYPQSQASRVT